MDERLIFGLGVAAVSLFLRWRFPAVSKPLATAGVVVGLGLIAWSQFLSIEPIYPLIGILAAAFAAAAVDWLVGSKPETPEEPTMPMHEAARYIAKDSVWAEQYLPEEDREWMARVERQVCHKLATDQLTAWGVFAPHHAMGSTRPTKIEPGFWENAGWGYEKLAFSDPVIGTRHGEKGDYSDIVLYPSQVRAVWPRRSLKARLLKRSPVERLDQIAKRTGAQRYPALWRAQDWNYSRFRKER